METLQRKTILITGANSGIGKAAAVQLARLGAEVILACRSRERGEQAVRDIVAATGSDRLELLQVDMSSQSSIRDAVNRFCDHHQCLAVLIHNAANFDAPGVPVKANKNAYNRQTWKRLWDVSAKMTGTQ